MLREFEFVYDLLFLYAWGVRNTASFQTGISRWAQMCSNSKVVQMMGWAGLGSISKQVGWVGPGLTFWAHVATLGRNLTTWSIVYVARPRHPKDENDLRPWTWKRRCCLPRYAVLLWWSITKYNTTVCLFWWRHYIHPETQKQTNGYLHSKQSIQRNANCSNQL